MGIESDQLVYDYLSRVGDLAQQQQLSSGTRMRLVATLRSEIDRQRVRQAADTPATVRRIIGTLGTPDELVAAAASSADGTVPLPQGPEEGSATAAGIPRPRRARLRKDGRKDGSRKGASEARREARGEVRREEPGTSPGPAASAPHRAGTDELGSSGDDTDWWSVAPGRFGDTGEFGAGTDVPGFRGGVEIPAVLRPPAPDDDEDEDEGDDEDDAYEDEEEFEEEAEAGEGRRRRRWLPRLRRARARARAEDDAPRGFSHPLLLLAAVLLVAGAVMDLPQALPALAGGWGLAYATRKLSRAQAKWAVMWLPGGVAAGALVWLWGRMDGRWGAPIAEGQMGPAIGQAWPWVVRGAAVASALYLVWRARGPRPGGR
ncbi:hypothetical protein OG782_21025 [Streptomyces sp. NBC_00876]|uniref:hypothetical protein n=1 Tax=Streptomyces sp. NBC_00876 TaxID=2975853 RepID=UPI00386AEC94|nr:hypothetical protein OG782_21025 [Streptomyces sp. NBC_00876]